MNDHFARPAGPGGHCSPVTAVRGSLAWFRADPFLTSSEEALVYVDDGLLICQDGKITAAGDYARLSDALPGGATVVQYRDKLILPGLVDSHVHYVQIGIAASYGRQLLDWLQQYVYPEEMKFSDVSYAREAARLFCAELLRNGVTTALVNCATYPQSVDALFEESTRRGMRLAAGKVLMDRNAPAGLLDASPEQAYEQSKKLIEAWHGTGRSLYAITPRFAVACTPGMLRMAGQLWREFPGTLVQAHLAENRLETAEVSALFPRRRDYVDVYEHHGLLGPGAVFAHAVYLSRREWKRLHETGSGIAHCPSSNLFLGSGLFSMRRAKKPGRQVRVGLGSDMAGGTSLSQLQMASEAYMVGQLDGYPIDGVKLFYLATRGGAAAMRLDGVIGSLEPGHEADFVVLDPAATPMLANRTSRSTDPGNLLFALAMLADDRSVFATYIGGRLAHERDQCATQTTEWPGKKGKEYDDRDRD